MNDDFECVFTDITGALKAVASGKRVTKDEWGDKRRYIVLGDKGLVHTHHPGEDDSVLHPWIMNDGDINGMDWVVL